MGIVSKNRPFTSTEISVMTRNFNVIIGEGGFGNVYLGTLKDGTKVAVKVLSPSSRQGYKEFRAEVNQARPKTFLIPYKTKFDERKSFCW